MAKEPEMPEHAALPVHPVPELPDLETWNLVLGDESHSVALDRAAVARLPHVELVDTFTCLEGWSTGPLRWRGVPLSAVLDAFGGGDGAYLAVAAGDFRAVMARGDLPADTLLADALDGKPLPREHGGPFRLVVPGGVCYQSVKWVRRIDVQRDGGGDTARTMASARTEHSINVEQTER